MHVSLAHYVIKLIVMVMFSLVLNLCYEFVESMSLLNLRFGGSTCDESI